jgi:hypothetical protein
VVFGKEQRVLRARVAAHRLHASGRTNTTAGTQAFLDRFEREVDPDATLDPAERARRAAHARKAYFLSLALKSSKKRAAAAARRCGQATKRNAGGAS